MRNMYPIEKHILKIEDILIKGKLCREIKDAKKSNFIKTKTPKAINNKSTKATIVVVLKSFFPSIKMFVFIRKLSFLY